MGCYKPLNIQVVFELQPRDAGGDNTQTTSREDKVRTIVDDVMEKLPELFNMRELMAKVEERTPYVIVCFQVLLTSHICSVY